MMLRQFLRSKFWQFFTIAVCLTIVFTPLVIVPSASANVVSGLIQWLWPKPRPTSVPAGSRDGKNTHPLASPGRWQNEKDIKKIPAVWNLRPTLLYKVEGGDIPILRSNNDDDNDPQLEKSSATVRSVYAQLRPSQDLKPGEEYIIHVGDARKNTPINLSILSVSERQKISAKLNAINERNTQKIHAKRIQIFYDAGLWSDVLQELVDNAKKPEDWKEIEKLLTYWSSKNGSTFPK
jgi:hypothetical protein